jgi:hypothetical protein
MEKVNPEPNKNRRVEIFIDDEWVESYFLEILAGDVFRLFDDCENPVEVGEEYYALSGAYPLHDTWAVNCEKESGRDKSRIDPTVNG